MIIIWCLFCLEVPTVFRNFMTFIDEHERGLVRGSPASIEILKKVSKNVCFLDEDYGLVKFA